MAFALSPVPPLARPQPASEPEREGAREPHAVPPRRRPRGSAARARARVVAHVRDDLGARAAALLHVRAGAVRTAWSRTFDERAVERGATLFANDSVGALRRDPVAAVRELPRCPTVGRHRAVRAPARARQVRRRGEPGQPRRPRSACRCAVAVGRALARHRAACASTRSRSSTSSLRPPGYADARMGRGERQGRAEHAERQRPRRVHREHPDHVR